MTVNNSPEDALEIVRSLTGGLGADVAIGAVGTTGLVGASSTPALLRLVGAGQLDPSRLVRHHFAPDEFEAAYGVFALKVVAMAGPVAAN